MKTIYIRIVLIFLICCLFSACGMHPDPQTGQPIKVDFDDLAAAALGWESWESMVSVSGGATLLDQSLFVSITNEDDQDEFILAVPQMPLAGTLGEAMLEGARKTDAVQIVGEGEAYAARLQSTLYAVQKAFASDPAAKIFMDATDRWAITFYPNSSVTNLWHMGVVDLKTRSMFQLCQQMQNCGSFINSATASDLTKYMEQHGWKAVPASAIPQGVRTYFLTRMGFLQNAWFLRLNASEVGLLAAPGVMLSRPGSILLPSGIDWDNLPQQ